LICKELAGLQKQYLQSPQELTLGLLGKKLARAPEGVTISEPAKRRALGTLICEAGFNVMPEELVTHVAKAASKFVTPLRLMKRAPLSKAADPTIARAVNYDGKIWYCSNKDVTMAGGGGSSGASNHCYRA
jgi:hypothetical protein